jgi:proline iminopeptidase
VLTDDGCELWTRAAGSGPPLVLCHGGPYEAAVEAACRSLAVPTLILEGAEDPRPRWAVDSLAAALPEVTRVVLPGVGHLPWLEAPEPALATLRGFLEAGR